MIFASGFHFFVPHNVNFVRLLAVNIPLRELFRSVELVWALWLAALISLFVCGRLILTFIATRRRRRSPSALSSCEAGASYSLGFVITIPIFALLICLVVDLSLILIAKIGTMYSAYAAARSAVVWIPSGVTKDEAIAKARLSAVQAMTPFASSAALHAPPIAVPAEAAAFVAAHRAYGPDPASEQYLTAKYRYAAWALSLDVTGGAVPEENCRVTLDYQAPFHLPGIGRLLGKRLTPEAPYTIAVRTVVELESHAPHGPQAAGGTTSDPSRPLGISYVPQLD